MNPRSGGRAGRSRNFLLMHAGGEPNTVADPLLETAERMPPASWQRALTGTLLNVGVVALWASEINLMRAIEGWCTEKDKCPWKHPIFLGVALKMVFVLVLPPALAVRWKRQRKLVDRRFFWHSGTLSFLLLGASVTWVASIPLTLPAINSALYQLYLPMTYVVSLPILRERCSSSKSVGVGFALGGVLLIILSGPTGSEGGKESAHAGDSELVGELLVLASAALYTLKVVLYKKWFGDQEGAQSPGRPQAAAEAAEEEAAPAATAGERQAEMVAAVPGAPRQPPEALVERNIAAAAAASEGSAPSPAYPLGDAAVVIGLQGFWSCMLGPLILSCAAATGLEPFSWPPASLALGYVLVAMMMAMYMGCLYGALAYSSPTFVAICSLFVTPVTLIWDVAAGRAGSIPAPAYVGLSVLIAALLLVIFHGPGDRHLKRVAADCARCLGFPETRAPLMGPGLPVTAASENGQQQQPRAA